MQVAVYLILDGLHHARVAMTDVGDGNAGNEVEVLRTIGAVQPASFRTFDSDAERGSRSLCKAMEKYLAIEVYGHAGKIAKKSPCRNCRGLSLNTPCRDI